MTPPVSDRRLPAPAPAAAEVSAANPFVAAPAPANTLLPWGLTPRHILVLCLVLGLVVVAWRAKQRYDFARSQARTAAQLTAGAVEAQFSRALSAVEVLGALARQSGGAIPNFPKVAADLLVSRPVLATLELQPGGVVVELVPRSGNERALGAKLLNHPVYGPGAKAAIQKKALTVEGPITLYQGQAGVIVRDPIFLRGRDGRDAFWGFAAVSLRLQDAFLRARLDDLYRDGYAYVILAPAAAGKRSATLAAHGRLVPSTALQQPIRIHDLEFQLALEPRSGWFSKTRLVLETFAAVVASCLLALLLSLLSSRRATEADLAQASQRLAAELQERKKAQDQCRAATDQAATLRADLKQTRDSLQLATEQEVRLNAAIRSTETALQAKQAELEQAQTATQLGEQMIASLKKDLQHASESRKQETAALKAELISFQSTISDLRARLDAAVKHAAETSEAAEPAEVEEPAPQPPVQDESLASEPPPAVAEAEPEPPAPEPALEPEPAAPESPEPPSASVEEQPAAPEGPVEPAAEAVPVVQPAAAIPAPAEARPTRAPRRRKSRPDPQMDLFAAPAAEPPVVTAGPALSLPAEEAPPPEPTSEASSQEIKREKARDASPRRPAQPAPDLDLSAFRKAAHQILPLFTGQDPGARDCFKDNREVFRSAFAPDAYAEFEHAVKKGEFETALEHLRKAARRHSITL